MYYTLYKSTNKLNGKFYIGVHSTDDPAFGTPESTDDYVGSGKWLWRAILKHGREVFDVEVIAYFDSVEDAYKAEGDVVTEQFIKEHNCYNLTPGGKIPPKTTKETARKTKETLKRIDPDHSWAKRAELTRISIGKAFTSNLNPNFGGKITSKKMWINNGLVNKQLDKDQVIPEGFIRGRLMKQDNNGRFV